MSVNRWFMRCSDCLAVSAIEPATAPRRNYEIACSCGGFLEVMGRVRQDRLKMDETRCACDARCTEARGPLCSCSCGGAHHGSGKLIVVEIDKGGVPRVTSPNPERGAEFREARDEAMARIKAAYGDGSTYVARDIWEKRNAACWHWRKAKTFKTHERRMSEFAKVVPHA